MKPSVVSEPKQTFQMEKKKAKSKKRPWYLKHPTVGTDRRDRNQTDRRQRKFRESERIRSLVIPIPGAPNPALTPP